MTEYLDRDDVLVAGAAGVGVEFRVADYGLLDAAVARPQATAFGVDAYPDLFTKAAALLQFLVRNHALVDGNKRTAWAAAWTFLYLNGVELDPDVDVDDAENFINSVVTEGDSQLSELAPELRAFSSE
ncbi:type II toxin-antitoxin system death-on-curing family toxin [Mycobacterium sp. 852014-52144_SCH5372336]|uniref:type II toxin-antitoxin system death-on-curing family toxin n=1 Tax=Mycobacterium sp. 852014-52144_SCH5372336 TaxID=1834115 RepID=UPI0007FE8A9C|nr:type II toxin-antitoxin system death-on-curing family toxin [Mycobacterium sp. 852014-52144_SCH5372336]OBB77124.1 death-on-curing protein [Mycobacterium sp. 852014-52144_SCH5372336]